MNLPKGNQTLPALPIPPDPNLPTVADLQACKDKHGFAWYWKKVTPESKVVDYRRYYFNLICGICQSFHWVSWDSLRAGTSHCCASCSKLPTEERIQEIIEKYQVLWRPTYPLSWKSSSDDRRMFHMKCQCGRKQFVRWSKFSQGQAIGCRSCMTGLRTHGLSSDPIYRTWRYLRYEGRLLCEEWKEFEGFRLWARKYYHPDFEIILWDKHLPYGPDNCDYVPRSRQDIKVEGLTDLPAGTIRLKKLRKSNQTVGSGNQ